MKQTPSPPPATCAPAAFLSVCRWLRRSLFHDKAGDIVFRAALAPLVLAAVLLAIPGGEARAHYYTSSAPFHSDTYYPLHDAARAGDLDSVNHFVTVHMVRLDDTGFGHSYNGYTPLHFAAQNGYTSIISVLLAAGAEVNVVNYVRRTSNDYRYMPLHLAIQSGHVFAVSMLLAADADVNPTIRFSRSTPLHLVGAGNAVEIAKLLIGNGADIHAKDRITGRTPLHQAALGYAGAVEVAKLLINKGADVHAKDSFRGTPLSYAASRGHVSIISALLAAGAEVNEGGFPPLHSAASNGHVSVVATLLAAGAEVNATTSYGDTPLHYAAPDGHVSVVSMLLAAGAMVNVKNNGGHTPLRKTWPYISRRAGVSVAFAVLIAAGGHWGTSCAGTGFMNLVSPTPPCISGAQFCGDLAPPQFYSPTLSACAPYDECLAAGDCALSRDVCWRGFDPGKFYDQEAGECVPYVECHDTATLNWYTNQCGCPYPRRYMRPDGSCVSSCARAETVVGYQCECTADTATNVNGACELLYPCHDSAVRQADNSGCECPAGTFAHGDPSGGYHRSSSSDRYGERPIIPDTAICHAGHAPIPHNPSGWESAVYANNPTLVAHFISGHGRDPDENYALHLAAEGGHYLAAKTLIESGADINLKRYYGSGYGDPPLHLAVRNRRAKLITLLLRRGADADAQSDDDGDTALHLAARRPDAAENAGLIAFLLDAGADPNIRNDDGWRPLDLAYHGGTPSDLTWQARRGMMAALIAGGATWSDECTSGAIPNENYRPSSGIADCVCPLHISERDSRGRCECPAHSHAQVNGRCLLKDSAQVEAEIVKMEAELLRLRASLVSLNARLSAAAEMPREMVEEIAERAADAAQEIKRRRDNFLALARADLAGAPPPPVAMSDTAAECRMLGGEVQIHSATGIRVCSGIDANDTFCLVDSSGAFPCRGLFRHVRQCNDGHNRPALNPFFCGAECGEKTARGGECGNPAL